DTLVVGELLDGRAGTVATEQLGDREMRVAEGGNLGQVGNTDHLMLIADSPQLLADNLAGAPADTDIHLVEHQRRYLVDFREDRLQRQQQPRAFAARRDSRQRLERLARVR